MRLPLSLRFGATFVLGLMAGGLVMGEVERRNLDQLMTLWAVTNTFEETITLRELDRGGPERTRARIVAALPTFARSLASHGGREGVDEALWAIRFAYEDQKVAIPEDLAPLLKDLPLDAAPRCRMRQESLAKQRNRPGT